MSRILSYFAQDNHLTSYTEKGEERMRRDFAAESFERVMALLPPRIGERIRCATASRSDFPEGLSEIRIRCVGSCAVVLSGQNLMLGVSISEKEADTILFELCSRSLYAHRDSIAAGYITIDGGIRVGICAGARYEGGRLVGACDPTGFVFRLPTARSECAPALYEYWQRCLPCGMLIFSPPGGGKTTAIRELAVMLGRGKRPMRVVIVDERREFVLSDYEGCSVDVIRGYDKVSGIEIALRSLSPEVIFVDEIGSFAEAEALARAGRGGVPLVATAHAKTEKELMSRLSIIKLAESGCFDCIARLYRNEAGGFCTDISKLTPSPV